LITLFQAPTIAQLADILQGEGVMDGRMLVVIQAQGTRPPLFFIGSTNYARALAPILGNEQPIYGLNIFGLQPTDDTVPVLDIKDIAEQYCQEIQAVQAKGPYYLAGYCADAKIAYEIAQLLQKRGKKIAFLGFIDVVWQPKTGFVNGVKRHWHGFEQIGSSYLFHKARQNAKNTKKRLQLALGKKLNALNKYTGKKSSRQLKDIQFINSYYTAMDNYEPQPYRGSIILILSTDWRLKHSSRLSELVDGLKIYEIVGYHDNLFVAPQVDRLGKRLSDCLND